MPDFWQVVEFSHMLLKEYINKNGVVIDATMGNGYDTIFLANLVGEKGRVISFDIQKRAIENSKRRLEKNKLMDRVEIIEDGHENLDKYIDKKIDAIIFNLGYLPGANKSITTKRTTTITAFKKGLNYLKIGGIIVLVIYTGHPGGIEELNAVLDFASSLDQNNYNVLRYNFINQQSSPQVLAVISRKNK